MSIKANFAEFLFFFFWLVVGRACKGLASGHVYGSRIEVDPVYRIEVKIMGILGVFYGIAYAMMGAWLRAFGTPYPDTAAFKEFIKWKPAFIWFPRLVKLLWATIWG